jgi:hypothetical protein
MCTHSNTFCCDGLKFEALAYLEFSLSLSFISMTQIDNDQRKIAPIIRLLREC